MPDVIRLDDELLDEVLAEARRSTRRRTIRRLHDGDWEHAHRMLNAMLPGTYSRPHRHRDRYQGESFVILRGRVAALVFTDQGTIDRARSVVLQAGQGPFGVDLPAGTWHAIVVLEAAALFEVKGQPDAGYDQATDKDFAPWAPSEGDPAAVAYVESLVTAVRS